MASGTFFSSLYYFEESLKSFNCFNAAQVNFGAGVCARILQTILYNPLIVIKTRYEVVGFNEYSSIFDAAKKIYINEGFRGYFTGVKVSLVRDVPFTGTFYPIYSFFKREMAQFYEMNRDHTCE